MVSNSFKNQLSSLLYKKQHGGLTKQEPKKITKTKGKQKRLHHFRARQEIRKVKTNLKVSFSIRVYIEEEKSPHKTKTNTKKINVDYYKKDSFENKTKYYLKNKTYKLFTPYEFMFNGDFKNIRPYMKHPYVFGEDFNDVVKLMGSDMFGLNKDIKGALEPYTGYDDFRRAVSFWISQLDNLLFVIEDLKVVGKNNSINLESLDYENEFANHDLTNIKLSTDYIHYNLNELEQTFEIAYKTDYVKNNFIKNACWFSLIIDTYKVSIEKYYKNIKLTYRSLYELLYPDREFDETDLSTNFKYVVEGFFKKFKLAIYVFDINKKIRCHYDPKNEGQVRNKNVSPECIYVMLHNNHVIRFNHDLNSLNKKLETFTLENDLILEPHKYYSLPKQVDSKQLIVIEDYNHLLDIIQNESGSFEAIYNGDLFELWRDIYTAQKYECDLRMQGNYITSISLNNIKNVKIRISNMYSTNAGFIEIENDTLYNNFITTQKKFMTSLLNKNYLSKYSNQVNEMFSYYKRGGIIGSFTELSNKQGLMLDYNKYYTYILVDMPKIPVINTFDNFTKYNGSAVQDLSIYFYKKLDNKVSYPLNRHGLMYGYNYKRFKPNVELLAVLTPSKLKDNNSESVVKELYENEQLDETMKKFIVNQTVGMTAKRFNKNHYSKAFTNQKEAESNKSRYGGHIFDRYLFPEVKVNSQYDLPSKKSTSDEKVYLHYINRKTEINEGFYPIALYIYDTAEAELFELKQKAEYVGMEVVGVNTDCIYTKDTEYLDVFKQEYPELFNYKSKVDFNSIGKLKYEYKDFQNMRRLEVRENYNIFVEPAKPIINEIKLNNEWDLEEIKSKLINKTIIHASVAGAGKTTAFQQLDNVLFITPWNSQKQDLVKKGFTAITLYNLLGLRLNGENYEKSKQYDVSPFEWIVFDEIYLYSVSDKERVNNFMNENNDLKYGATGDPNQLDPIESLSIESQEYHKNIINSMFINQITLQQNKRCKNKADQDLILKISKVMLYGTQQEKCSV